MSAEEALTSPESETFWRVVRLSAYHNATIVARIVGCSPKTVRRILKRHKEIRLERFKE